METITLPSGGLTSRLGFGGTVLKGGIGKDDNLRLLQSAYAAGVRHFDVAPSYGLGVAEGILGEFLQGVRDSVTVTTKVGIPRPSNPGMLANLRTVIRPFLAFAPGIRRRLGRSVYKMSVSGPRFDIDQVKTSVAESLRHLRTDHVDVLLLHELTAADVSEELQRFLEDALRRGMILNYGVGSLREDAEAVVQACPGLTGILQTSWSAGDEPLDFSPQRPFVITHGAMKPFSQFSAWLKSDRERLKRLSAALSEDLASASVLADLMMAAALAQNPDGMVLVSSTRPERFARHAALVENTELLNRGRTFAELLRAEKPEARVTA